ncbi:unnamed protein product, partial [Rotaria sp. Silwood2]
TIVCAQITWKNCEDGSNDIKLLNLTLNPHPIVVPGSLSIMVTFYTNQRLENPLKTKVSITKKTFLGDIPVPCDIYNFCSRDDTCSFCKECKCPIEKGIHTVTSTMKLNSIPLILAGEYQAQLDMETSLGGKGCAIFDNISVEESK